MAVTEKKTCIKCKKTQSIDAFYTHKDGTKPDLCKKCQTMHIDNFDETTFTWLLKEMDVPYIPSEWNVLRDRAFAKNPKLNGTSVFGKYMSKMKLKQWREYSWEDTERLRKEDEEKYAAVIEENVALQNQAVDLKVQLERGEISEAEYKTKMSTEVQHADNTAAALGQYGYGANPYLDDANPYGFGQPEPEPELGMDLTAEDREYLKIKWGNLYKPNEWVRLEQMYNEMDESFDIQDADTINTLKLICKTTLKMNDAIDIGDLDGYQKLSRTYESLRKSAKFTAAQSKEKKAGEFDSVGQVVLFAESKKGGGKIPRHQIELGDMDKVDKTIVKLKDYYKHLIYNDPTIKQQIENWMKKRDSADQMKQDRLEAEKNNGIVELSDADLALYHSSLDEQREEDNT